MVGRPGRLSVALLLAGTLLLSLVLPTAGAHAPSNPRDFETRLLTDQNDDCGGHGADGCRGTHDLLALGLREAFFQNGTDAEGFAGTHRLVWSLWMAPGTTEDGTYVDTISYRGPDGEATIRVTTADDATFDVEAAGFVALEGPYPLLLGGEPDGDRFGIDIHIDRDAAGLAEGATLRGFRVAATVDDAAGDIMPGTYITDDGDEAPKADNEREAPSETVRPSYVLDGPDGYLRIEAPVEVSAPVGAPFETTLMVENRLRDRAQNVTLLLGAEMEGIRFGDQAREDASAQQAVVAVAPGASVEVKVVGPAGTEAGRHEVAVHAVTDAGGLASTTFPVVRTAGDEVRQDAAEEGPAVVPVLVVLLFVAMVWAARRDA